MKTTSNKSLFPALIFLYLFIFRLLPISAQDVNGDSLADNPLRDLSELANQDRARAQAWWYAWLGGYSAATAGQGIVYFAAEKKTVRQDMALGAATTFLGAMGQLLTPVLPRDYNYGNGIVSNNGSGGQTLSPEESAVLLKALALREKEGRSWKVHAIAGVVNVGSGLITWLGFKRTFMDGLENFALNTLITEAQIWTQPTRAIRDYEHYCREQDFQEREVVPAAYKPESEWTLNVYPGGFSLRLDF